MKKYIFLTVLVLVVGMVFCACAPSLTQSEKQTIIDNATAIQTDGGTYSADTYDVIQLKKGDAIYGMLPGQSAFYTDKATVDKADSNYVIMYEMFQMQPHPEFGYRTQLGEYKVLEDMWVATGKCLANKEVAGVIAGDGGGTQYVIPDFETKLELVNTVDLHE